MRTEGSHAHEDAARLLAIVQVAPEKRVQCQQPGCGHGVHKAIHIVREGSELLVLGSTCFRKRYGITLGSEPAYSGGSGRRLTEEERRMLVENTEALLAQFAAEALAQKLAQQEADARRLADEAGDRQRFKSNLARLLARNQPSTRPAPAPTQAPNPSAPWPWQSRRNQSVALFTSPEGDYWLRVEHQNGTHMLVPVPPFDGWESALPADVGTLQSDIVAVASPDIVMSIRILRSHGFHGPEVGRWVDIKARLKIQTA